MAISRSTKVIIGVLAAISVGACGNEGDTVHQSLQTRIQEVFDMGVVPIPNSPNQFHAYRVINAKEADHFVYVVEHNSSLVSGATVNYSVPQGKTRRNDVVTSVIAPNAMQQAPADSQQAPQQPAPQPAQQQSESQLQPQPQQEASAPSNEGGGVLEVKCATQVQCLQIAEAIHRIVPQ